ncbi:hypothetical protein AWW66_31650 [Micromonospora rosaria]|uniref:Uncharacterized protein n=1 Tax=Micromonospora rosaria TaxID=47874 RepID=A0A136PIB2_9ACTN|nr:hypothetical protein AWW66_31650 [Micromonospora rosaria]
MLGLVDVSHCECGEESSDLRYRVVDHHAVVGAGSPFSVRDRATDSQAWAAIARVMWAYQARQSRTWYSSRPASFLACWKHSSIAHLAPAVRARSTRRVRRAP